MRPLFRYVLAGSLIVAPIVVVIAATMSARSAIPRLLAQETEAAGACVSPFLQREFAGAKTPAQIAEIEKRYWYQARTNMQREGASQAEAGEVVTQLQGKFSRAGDYAIPVHVRAASVWGRRVWAFTFAWEWRQAIEKDKSQPCRRWTVVIAAEDKHHILAEDSCH